jgi:Transposase
MDSKKYIGMDVHKESISIAVMNGAGKIVMESVIETKASMILQFIDGLRGDVQVTFEEGTSAAWLYDLLKPHVTKLLVCDPRKNRSMREGNQNDKIDARRLAELLRLNHLNPVYHGEHGLRSLKELVRSYLTITKDLGRVMSRVKAIYRSWAIPCTGKQVYAPRAIVPSGSGRSPSRECADGPSFTINNSMRCGWCVSKCGGICSQRARNTRRGNCSARSLRLVRSGPPYCLGFCRPRTVSEPSDSYGHTADLASRPKAAPITVVSTGNSNERRNRSLFAD